MFFLLDFRHTGKKDNCILMLVFVFFQDISEYKCENGKMSTYVPHKPVSGVIGAAFSVVSIMVANILRLFRVSTNQDEIKYNKSCL